MEKRYVRDLKKDWNEKQKFNIDNFNSLDREGLDFNQLRRELLLKKFDTGEKLYIVYPGKESVSTNNKNDFYPVLTLENGEPIETKAFSEVWDDLFTFKELGFDMSALATIFIRMAYMYDSKKISKSFSYEDYFYENDIRKDKKDSGTLEFEYYEYAPDSELFKELGILINEKIQGANIIPYLAYIDLIAQNEDCKYSLKQGKEWKHKSGRLNTCLTHVYVIALIEHECTFAEIMKKFQNGSGVAPFDQQYKYSKITNNRICK